MRVEIEVTIELLADFHLGTGSGRGRTVDAVVLKSRDGAPYLPGSSLKGLARWYAGEQVVAVFPDLKRACEVVFGEPGASGGTFYFEDAYLADPRFPFPTVSGRSSRERRTGVTKENHLFFTEIASRCSFKGRVRSRYFREDAEPSVTQQVLLVLMALRRIEALGSGRRRGLGQCAVSVTVIEGPVSLKSLSLPYGAAGAAHFEELLAAHDQATAPPRDVVTDADDANQTPGVFLLLAEAETPLVCSHDQGPGNVIGTLDHVPGSSLRGAIAGEFIRAGWDPESAQFQELFTREKLRFGPLYPLKEPWKGPRTMPMPIPASFVECKSFPGVLHSWRDVEDPHGVTDRLTEPVPQSCHCEAPLVPVIGWAALLRISSSEPDVTELQCWKPPQQSIQRTKIDEKTLRAREGMLYSTDSLLPGTWFAGYVWGPRWALDRLESLWPKARGPLTVRVGKSRTRGHGRLRLWRGSLDQVSDLDSHYPLIYSKNAGDNPMNRSQAKDEGFTLTCYSDLIAVDRWVCPVTVLDSRGLWELLAGTGDQPPFERVAAFVRVNRVSGFNGLGGVPRSTDIAIAAGSTWRFRWTDDSRKDQAWARLQAAHREGLGLRRGEGFGRVMLDSPLHQASLRQTEVDPEIYEARKEAARIDARVSVDDFPNFWVDSPLEVRHAEPAALPDWARSEGAELVKKFDNRVAQGASRVLHRLAAKSDPVAEADRLRQAPLEHEPEGKGDTSRKVLNELLKAASASIKERNGKPDDARQLFLAMAEKLLERAEGHVGEESHVGMG